MALHVERARFVWETPERVHSPGEAAWDAAGRLVRVGSIPRRRGIPDRALLPGLVDAHVHLQLPALPRAERSFPGWLRAVMAARQGRTDRDHERTAARHLVALLRAGCTAVGEVDSTGLSPGVLRRLPFAGRCYQELVGYDLTGPAARRAVAGAFVPGTRACPAGLSPHAPYSVSAALFRAARRRGVPLMVHAAETGDEQRLLHRGDGPFRRLLQELGKWPPVPPPSGPGAVALLERLGLLGPRTALVHAQCLEHGDLDRIVRTRTPVIVCPGTLAYFRRPAPPVPRWLSAGVTVALGTDSRASNGPLSMLREMARARRYWPGLAPRRVLAMASTRAGRAISRPATGRLAAGGRADLLAVPTSGCRDADETLEAFTSGELPVDGVWLRGLPLPRVVAGVPGL